MPLRQAASNLHRLAALFAALLLGFAGVMRWQSWQAMKDEQTLQLTTVLELVEKATDRYFVQAQAALAALEGELRDVGLDDLPAVQRRLRTFHDLHPELTGVNLLALDGRFLAASTTPRLTGLPSVAALRDYPAIAAAYRPEAPFELARPLLGPVSGRWVLPLRYTIGDGHGRALAFIVAAAPVELLQTFWSDAPIVQRASIALMRDDGYLLSRYPAPAGAPPAVLYGQVNEGALWQQLQAQRFPARGYVEGRNELADAEFGTVYKRLTHYPVTLAVSMPLAEFEAAWLRRVRVPFALLALLGVVGLASYLWLLRRQRAWLDDRMRVDAQLRASEALLDRTGRLAAVGGWQLELPGRELTWSAQAQRIHELDGTPALPAVLQQYPPAERERLAAALEAALAQGQGWNLELPLTTGSGRRAWVRSLGEVECDAEGRPRRVVGAVQDITQYREQLLALRQEQALRQQAEAQAQQLDALLRERSEMLDVLAHEVRQPLNNASAALQSAAAVLADVGEQAAAPRLARASGVLNQVLGRIDNTLAVAALLARPGPIQREDTDIDTLIAVVLADLPAAQRGRVIVERASATRTAPMDMGLVRLALRNLLLNALQYSPAASPVVVRVVDSDEPLALVIEVEDRGPGIAPELAPRLFQRGARGPGSAGHGLGLYIVHRVMELHDGRVLAQPAPGGGLVMRLVFEPAADYTTSNAALNA